MLIKRQSFQSYLYGIEIGCNFAGWHSGWRFNRTFIEFKSDVKASDKDLSSSFNRTFMELKYNLAHILGSGCGGFQSYLYGIEIR